METKVWLSSQKLANGKRCYYLRWIDRQSKRWRNRKSGTDARRAAGERVALEAELNAGTYRDIRRVDWADFILEVMATLARKSEGHQTEVRREIQRFADDCGCEVRHVDYAIVRSYINRRSSPKQPEPVDGQPPKIIKPPSPATLNKAVRCLKLCFREAVRLRYLAVNPIDDGWSWEPEDVPEVREITRDEEVKLLDAAEAEFGYRYRAFIMVALTTGARLRELTGLRWADIDLDGGTALFRQTKGRRDRRIPLVPEAVQAIRRVQAATLQACGPFTGIDASLGKRWPKIIATAGIPHATVHDCRRTFVSRLSRCGVPLSTVQAIVGHASITTTKRYYDATGNAQDMAQGIERLRASIA